MQEFTFIIAPRSGYVTWAIQDGHVMRKGGKLALPLHSLESFVWSEGSYRATRYGICELSSDLGNLTIECRDDGDDESRAAFVACMIALCEALTLAQPNLSIDTGNRPAWLSKLIGVGKTSTPAELLAYLRTDPNAVRAPKSDPGH